MSQLKYYDTGTSTWLPILVGAQGTTGAGTQGVQGVQGTQGTTGAGTQGLQGLQGVIGKYTLSSTAPSSPSSGDAWVNTEDGRTFIYNGTAWFEPYDNLIGLTGAQGTAGFIGSDGAQGTSGALQPASKIIAMTLVLGG